MQNCSGWYRKNTTTQLSVITGLLLYDITAGRSDIQSVKYSVSKILKELNFRWTKCELWGVWAETQKLSWDTRRKKNNLFHFHKKLKIKWHHITAKRKIPKCPYLRITIETGLIIPPVFERLWEHEMGDLFDVALKPLRTAFLCVLVTFEWRHS